MGGATGLVRVPWNAEWLGWFADEAPGMPVMARHTATIGLGSVWADRWPDPRLLLVRAQDDVLLRGEPEAVPAQALVEHVQGFVDAPERFEPVLRAASEQVTAWPRIVQVADEPAADGVQVASARRIRASDGAALGRLPEDMRWIWKPWGSPEDLSGSGSAWGALEGDMVVSVACSFYVGQRFEELAVATRNGWRRRGLSTACARGLCADVAARGRRPSWTTSPDNLASLRVARRLGFRHVRDDVLYVVGIDVPAQ